MSEGARLTVWMIIVILNIYIFIDYEWRRAGKEARYVKGRKKRAKGRKAAGHRRCSDHLSLIWNDMDRFYDGHK